jgi:hypothetical protein
MTSFPAKTVTFKVKDYRINGTARYKTMTLDAHEFIRRFLIHVLPAGFHRIRHYGLLASGVKADNLVLARKLLDVTPPAPEPEDIAAEQQARMRRRTKPFPLPASPNRLPCPPWKPLWTHRPGVPIGCRSPAHCCIPLRHVYSGPPMHLLSALKRLRGFLYWRLTVVRDAVRGINVSSGLQIRAFLTQERKRG